MQLPILKGLVANYGKLGYQLWHRPLKMASLVYEREIGGADWQCSGVDSGVIFELHSIVLLLFFLLDAAKTSPQTQNIRPLFL